MAETKKSCTNKCEGDVVTESEDAYGCSRTTCQEGKFGDTCSYSCHCTPTCNQTTGVCNRACDPGWFGGNGQTCQRGNVAYNKTATSSATDYARNGWTADKAVDGNRDQYVHGNSCFHSHSADSKAMWTVDLGQQYRIHDVRIYNRIGYAQLIGTAVLTLSNSSSSTPGVTCYTFPSYTHETIQSVYDVTCDGTGRYFTITHSIRLNLCEAEIYGMDNFS
ncbi:fucolectin-6-like [Haliotis cracherodii]|uniref:fucolectin-6-like n=1 Tax=Haliotis cracherodii TaxID=6455 RepID=UPI0039EAC8D8